MIEAYGGAVRPRGMGRLFPPWLSTRDPEAMRGSARIRCVDGDWIVGLNLRTRVYEIWGPSLSAGGWICIQEVRDDRGQALCGCVPWELIAAALLRGRNSGESAVDRVQAHNERLRASRERDARNELLERSKYLAGSVHADGKHPIEDVLRGMEARWV